MRVKMILKKQNIILMSIFILFLCSTMADQADILKVRVIIDKANIREKPDISSPAIAEVPLEAVLESEVKEGEWYKVSFKYRGRFTISGFVHQSDVEVISVIEEERPAEVRPEPEIEKEEISIPEDKIEEKLKEVPVERKILREERIKYEKTPTDEQFFASKNEIINSFEEKKEIFLKEKEKNQKNIEKSNRKIKSLNASIASSQTNRFFIDRILDFLAYPFFPVLTFLPLLGGLFASHFLLMIFFPIFLINIFLYLLIREKEVFKRRKKLTIALFLIILLFFYLPVVFGEEQGQKNLQEKGQTSEIEQKLDNVNALLQMTEIERAIYMLEKKPSTIINIPEIAVSNPYLKPWRIVNINKPEYYFTVGSLYYEIRQKSKAVDELNEIFKFDFRYYRREVYKYQIMLISLAKFFIEENMLESASKSINSLVTVSRDVALLLDFADYLYQKMMHDSAQKVINRAIAVAENYEDLIKLADFLLNKKKFEEAAHTIEKAIYSAYKLDVLSDLVKFTVEKNMYEQTKKAVERYITYARKTEDFLNLAEFLIGAKMKENASRTVKAAIEKSRDIDSLIKVSRFALNNEMYEHAISSIKKALEKWRKSWSYIIDSPNILYISKKLPTDEKITLPVYLGIIQQKAGFFDGAKFSYEVAIIMELDEIIDSFAFKIRGNLNNFFYMKQLWQIVEEFENLKKLNPIFSLLQEKYLEDLKKKNNEQIEQLKKEIETLKQNQMDLKGQIGKLRVKNIKEQVKFSTHLFRLIAFLTVVILVIIWMVKKSLQSAREVSIYKFFAFVWKFVEVWGWVLVFTVMNFLAGVINILIAQFMQIIQKIQQNRSVHKVQST